MHLKPAVAAVAAVAALGPVPSLAAQSLWLGPDRRVVLLEVFHPTFSGSALEFPSFAAYLTGRLALGEAMALQVELPVAHANLTSALADLTETGIGSPYVGLVFRRPGSRVWGEVGARIPIATDNASLIVGTFADLDRLPAWSSDVLPVTALAGYRWSSTWGGFVSVRGGPGIWVDVGDAESEAVLHASFQAGVESARYGLSAAVTSLTVISADGGLGERSLFQGGVVAEARFGTIRPGVTVFVPLDDDLGRVIDLVYGLRLAVILP
jgi:hypothetical protein